MMWFSHLLVFEISVTLTMAGDATFMGMMNEIQDNHGLDWDGLGSTFEE
jgi:hypothetical protein